MRQRTYLNAILTVNAGLLAVLAWTQIAERPVLTPEAVAQSPTVAFDAGAQRQRMVDAVQNLERSIDVSMQDLIRSVDLTRATLKNGEAQVKVANTAELVGRNSSRDQRKRLSEMMMRQ